MRRARLYAGSLPLALLKAAGPVPAPVGALLDRAQADGEFLDALDNTALVACRSLLGRGLLARTGTGYKGAPYAYARSEAGQTLLAEMEEL